MTEVGFAIYVCVIVSIGVVIGFFVYTSFLAGKNGADKRRKRILKNRYTDQVGLSKKEKRMIAKQIEKDNEDELFKEFSPKQKHSIINNHNNK